jgi:tetratricopeptide (TPR) repeat protein
VTHLAWIARLRGRADEAVALGRRALRMTEQHEHTWWEATACAVLGGTLLKTGDRAGALTLLERGLAAAQQSGVEAYLLRAAAPLAAAAGSRDLLGEADALLEQTGVPPGGAWVLGYEAYLSIAQAWLGHDDPERARVVLAPLLRVAGREPWTATLAEALVIDGRALARLGHRGQARSGLVRAARLARDHGLPYVLADAQAARRDLSA